MNNQYNQYNPNNQNNQYNPNIQNQGYPGGMPNNPVFQPQQPKKKSKAVIIVIVAVIIAVLAAAGVIIWKVISEQEEESRDKKPYTGGNYAVKSKITSQDSAASALQKAFAVALEELDEEDWDLSYCGVIEIDGSWGDEDEEYKQPKKKVLTKENAKAALKDNVKYYFSSIKNVKKGAVYIYGGSCIGVICTTDGEYWGTYPAGALSYKEYKNADELITFEEVQEALEEKYYDLRECRENSSS